MTVLSFSPSPKAHARRRPSPLHRGVRAAFTGVGVVLMTVSVPLALLPGHLGVPLFAVGLVVVLRNSFVARRRFIEAQRRHPKLLFPLRRLIRRNPEVIPVIWQQMLRFERLVLPARWRVWKRLRRKVLPRRKASFS